MQSSLAFSMMITGGHDAIYFNTEDESVWTVLSPDYSPCWVTR